MTDSNFNAQEYWAGREFAKWVVVLGSRKGRDRKYVRARDAQAAIDTAIIHSHLTGRISGRARLATPTDLGATRQ